MINPGSKLAGPCKKCLWELAGSAENFPKHPLILKGFLHSSLQPSNKREKAVLDLKHNGDTCHYIRNPNTTKTLACEQDTYAQQYSSLSCY